MKRQTSRRDPWDFSLYAFEFYEMHSNIADQFLFASRLEINPDVSMSVHAHVFLFFFFLPVLCWTLGGGAVDYCRNASWEM